MPSGTNDGRRPTPSDAISVIAGRILAKGAASGLAREAMPEETVGQFVSVESFNSLLADAKKLAGHVLDAELQEAGAKL